MFTFSTLFHLAPVDDPRRSLPHAQMDNLENQRHMGAVDSSP